MSQLVLAAQVSRTLQANVTITGAASSPVTGAYGAHLVRISAANHGLLTNDIVQVSGIVGTVEANAQWVITKIDANTFDLQNSVFKNAYVSGGTAKHIGFATTAVAADNTLLWTQQPLYPYNPEFCLTLELNALSGGDCRIIAEAAADQYFISAQPLCQFNPSGKTGQPVESWDSVKNFHWYDLSTTSAILGGNQIIGSAGDVVRLRVYLDGGPGTSATVSAWVTY